MTNKSKIINDPVFGFITIPNAFLYDLIQHPYFQRLNRIKQLGVAFFVYPGAQHTRFQHSLGAMYLMNETIKQLRFKGQEISNDEANGLLSAILLHDIGHAPFSHVLENILINGVSHEEITLMLMKKINAAYNGELDIAIKIFNNLYHKKFMHQLVSGQLDMDRLDYLRRDSFFTGVTEGTIGSARIIKMLNVQDDKLVVEAKGIYSIENFLVARRFMYWQVYLHKTSVAAEKLLVKILKRAKALCTNGETLFASPALAYFIRQNVTQETFNTDTDAICNFIALDDSDILSAIKVWAKHPDIILSTLSQAFINRKLFKVKQQDLSANERNKLIDTYVQHFGIERNDASYFFEVEPLGISSTYHRGNDQILIQSSDGSLLDIADASDMLDITILDKKVAKNYFCYYSINR
ncbi:MAG TPA: HD domain-containing protein [Bacteroidales bacterium]|nr:HD domain-containing protein [Bacteroidales bacterium]